MFDWTPDKVMHLLDIFKNSAILWDSKEPNYYNSVQKAEVWQEIANKLDVSREECKKKMESLKASYRREKAKTRRSNSGGQGEDSYKSRWFAYDAMKFLDDVTGSRDTTSFIKGWNSEDNSEDVYDGLENPKTVKTSLRMANKRKNEETHSNYPAAHEGNNVDANTFLHYYRPSGEIDLEAVQNQCSTFGAYVSSKLRMYGDRERAIAQHRIASVFFDIDMALYSVDIPNNVVVSTATRTSGGGPSQIFPVHEDDQAPNLPIKISHSECSDSN